MNRELKNKLDDALFHFYMEADKDTIAEFLKENVLDLDQYSKKKKQFMFIAKATVAQKRNEYLLSLVNKFQDALLHNIEKPVTVLKQLLQENASLSLYRNLDMLSKEDIIEIIKDKNLVELLDRLDNTNHEQ